MTLLLLYTPYFSFYHLLLFLFLLLLLLLLLHSSLLLFTPMRLLNLVLILLAYPLLLLYRLLITYIFGTVLYLLYHFVLGVHVHSRFLQLLFTSFDPSGPLVFFILCFICISFPFVFFWL